MLCMKVIKTWSILTTVALEDLEDIFPLLSKKPEYLGILSGEARKRYETKNWLWVFLHCLCDSDPLSLG